MSLTENPLEHVQTPQKVLWLGYEAVPSLALLGRGLNAHGLRDRHLLGLKRKLCSLIK